MATNGQSVSAPLYVESEKIEALELVISDLHQEIPVTLVTSRETLRNAIDSLEKAGEILARSPLQRKDFLLSQNLVTRVRVELGRAREQKGITEDTRNYINTLTKKVPTTLKASPSVQSQCLDYLKEAEEILARYPLERKDIIESRLIATKVDIELIRTKSRRWSFLVVGALVYIAAVLIVFGYLGGLFNNFRAEDLNGRFMFGIPVPVLVWSIIGSLTSMLLRAGQFPFLDLYEAIRWLLFRPVVGIVMGVLTYLMVIAGLFVFGGVTQSQTPELIWVIAFIGSFSDTLSINLLQGILGRFRPMEGPDHDKEQGQEGSQTTSPPTVR